MHFGQIPSTKKIVFFRSVKFWELHKGAMLFPIPRQIRLG